MSLKIIGTGSYVPEKILTNDEMTTIVDTSDEWIKQRVGISERRISVNETAGDMAVKAAKNAILSAGITADKIDLIIAASISSDDICPTVAGTVEAAIGASCPAFDINSACSGFIFALDTAAKFMLTESYNTVLVLGAERLSKLVDWTDRGTCIIFGDGAGACVVQKGENYLSSYIQTSGGSDVIHIPAYSGKSPFYKNSEQMPPFIFMNGQETFKFAVNKIVNDIAFVAEKAGISVSEIDYIVPHQANIRIIDYASKRLGISKDKFYVNINKYGNTSSASVPIALDELNLSGKLKKGNIVVLCAFGGGLSDGACVIKW